MRGMSKDRKNCLRLVKINLGILDKMQKEEQADKREENEWTLSIANHQMNAD